MEVYFNFVGKYIPPAFREVELTPAPCSPAVPDRCGISVSQADLSRMTGIRPNTISELYNEVATRISLDHLDLICEALDCKLSDLIVLTPNKESRVRTRTGIPITKGEE